MTRPARTAALLSAALCGLLALAWWWLAVDVRHRAGRGR